jgi:hypothetical protein
MIEKKVEILPTTAGESIEIPPTTMSDWLLEKDQQALALLRRNPSTMNDVTKTFLMLYAANKAVDPPLGPPRQEKGWVFTKTVRDPLASTAELGMTAIGMGNALHQGLENERPGPIVDQKAVERNIQKVDFLKNSETLEGAAIDPRTQQYLRLIAVTMLGDRMKEAQFVNEYFDSLQLQPLELVSIHTMCHRTIEAIDKGKLAMPEARGRLFLLCRKLEGHASERLPFVKRYLF